MKGEGSPSRRRAGVQAGELAVEESELTARRISRLANIRAAKPRSQLAILISAFVDDAVSRLVRWDAGRRAPSAGITAVSAGARRQPSPRAARGSTGRPPSAQERDGILEQQASRVIRR